MLFALLVAHPVVGFWLGLNIRNRERLPSKGPAIIVANHNSHLDILTLLSLFPLATLHQVRPAAAADYFLRNRLVAWFVTTFIGIIPVARGTAGSGHNPLAGCEAALRAGNILILFPEGTRGAPEQMSEIKSGLWYLARQFPDVPVIPIYLYGLGRAMSKGTRIPVPFFVDAAVGRPISSELDKEPFKEQVRDRFNRLRLKITASMESDNES